MEQFFYSVGEWMQAAGPWAYIVAPLVMACVAILPIPAEAPAMVNGMLFGPIGGTVVTWCGAMLGAVASFEIARGLGRPVAERFIKREKLDRADEVVLRAGWGGLLLARFMPLIAFTVLNWGAGLTPVGRWRFIWTTAIGIIPATIVFTVSGWGLTGLLERLPWAALAFAIVLLVWLWWRGRRNPTGSTADEHQDRNE